MNDDGVKRPTLPASLVDADPFAAPRTGPQRTPAGTPGPADTADAVKIPCPCACECGNDTDKTYSDVESLSAARFLRCASCAAAGHHGEKWMPEDAPRAQRPSLPSTDREVTGARTGERFVIRQPVVDAEDDEWDREIARRLAKERREAAIAKWQASLPERWQLPYEGEELVPEVEERLERLRLGNAGDHGTSLLCIGPFGSGKTWVAYTYARAAVDRWLLWPQEIRVGTETEILGPIALASPWEVAAKAAELLKPTLKMLIIDDVGTGNFRNMDNQHAAYTQVVNWMYEHKRALVITTNKVPGSGKDLDKWIGPTAYERLKHMVGARQVFRDENKRAELTAQWEAEYQDILATRGRD